MLIKMASKNYKDELDDVFKKFDVFAKANQYYRQEKDKIEAATKASINQAVSASSASDEKKQELKLDKELALVKEELYNMQKDKVIKIDLINE